MKEDTIQKKIDMVEKIFEQVSDKNVRRALFKEVISSAGGEDLTITKPITTKPTMSKPYREFILDERTAKSMPQTYTVKRTKRPISKIRKLILALLLPVEIMCELFVTRPRLSLFAIFGVILFIGKFVSANVAMGMAFLMLLTFGLMGRREKEGEEPRPITDDYDNPPILPGGFPYGRYYPGLFQYEISSINKNE